jgi:PAS domain S-box-containing protein
MDSRSDQETGMYRAALETLPDAVMIHDETTVHYANPATLRVLHASRRDQVEGVDFARFVHEDARSAGKGRQAVLAESGHPIPPVRLKLIGVDGAIVYTEARAWRIVFDGRTATLVVAMPARG